MRSPLFAALVLLASVAATGCPPPYGYDHRHPYDPGREREMTQHEAWEIVQRDPCRYDEYRRFAEHHKNPDKRREVVWRLAHEGCHHERDYDYDDR
jgi:hypothetical protein